MVRSRLVLAAALVLGAAMAARAQVQSDPNQIQGTFRFANVNPEAQAILEQYPVYSGWVDSSHPTLGSATTDLLPSPDGTGRFELSVQTTAEGESHDISLSFIQLQSRTAYDGWVPVSATSPRVFPEPAPDAEMVLEECAALIRLSAYDEAGTRISWPRGSASARQDSDDLSATLNEGNWDDYLVLPVRSEPWSVRVGVSGYETVIRTIGPVGCDEIVDLEVTLIPRTPPDPPEPMECTVTGVFDVVGEVEGPLSARGEIGTWIETDFGGRHEYAEPPAEGHFELSGVHVGTRRATAHASLRAFNRFQQLTVYDEDFDCPDGATVDLGDRFVMRPGSFLGDLFVAGPAPTRDSDSAFMHLLRNDSGPHAFYRCTWSRVEVRDAAIGGGGSRTCSLFEGEFHLRSLALEGEFEILASTTGGQTLDFQIPEPFLWFNRSSLDGPRMLAYLDIGFPGQFVPVAPGSRTESHVRLCTSEVAIGFESLAGEFEQAEIRAVGGLEGTDFEGTAVHYEAVGMTFPDFGDPPVTSTTVHLMLAEGSYVITPRVLLHDPGGGMTRTTLPEFTITVGCRENLRLFDTLQLHVTTPPPACADGDVRALGSVSGGADVAKLAWRVNGGAESVACEPCGVDPEFDITVPTLEGDNEILIVATDASDRTAHAVVMTRRVTEPAIGALDPLRIARDPSGGIRLTWGGAPADLFAVHRGSIASLSEAAAYDHERVGACDLPSFEFADSPPDEDAYYLVTAGCGLAHGSYGRDALGAERPASPSHCP